MKHTVPLSVKGAPIETKSVPQSDDDQVKAALVDLTKTVTAVLDDHSKKIESLSKWSEDIDFAKNREKLSHLFGGSGDGDAGPEHKAISAYIRSGGRDDTEIKGLSVGSDPDGGYIVLPVLSSGMTKRLFDQSPIRRLARVETMENGDAFEELVDLDDVGATWVGEKQSRPTTTTAQLGKFSVPLREIYALQAVTQRLLDDSSRDIGGWAIDKISDKFGRSEGVAFVSGDGILRPRGILTYDTDASPDASRPKSKIQFVKTGDAAGFPTLNVSTGINPADCLIDIVYSLRSPYKQGGNVGWLMNSTTASVIRKFKDGDGNYIWQNAIAAGQPASLLGFPVELDENMPDIAGGNYPVAFGNWTLGYCVVDRPGLKLLLDPFTDKPNVLFYVYKRVGGGVANFDAIKLLKVAS